MALPKNTPKDLHSQGGIAQGVKACEAALSEYYKNPRRCESCHSVIQVRPTDQIRAVRKKKFCNKTCYHSWVESQKASRSCPQCLEDFSSTRNKTFCSRECQRLHFGTDTLTKGALFESRTSWQSARSAIQKMARAEYFRHNQNPSCAVCRYSHHVEVAHRNPVSKFQETALIGEINHIDNLVGLCPNHHWEYDNGKLDL